ncbi:hypothetical protein V492_01480 [Pseudogymnoascus sp. VKM F-4246]|nr:hypothetical protein V492_01480 [Pseudogymnoascus sp. VKM F-4246]
MALSVPTAEILKRAVAIALDAIYGRIGQWHIAASAPAGSDPPPATSGPGSMVRGGQTPAFEGATYRPGAWPDEHLCLVVRQWFTGTTRLWDFATMGFLGGLALKGKRSMASVVTSKVRRGSTHIRDITHHMQTSHDLLPL